MSIIVHSAAIRGRDPGRKAREARHGVLGAVIRAARRGRSIGPAYELAVVGDGGVEVEVRGAAAVVCLVVDAGVGEGGEEEDC
jgi:hypothetical protein